jgi:hypothetical protein
MQLKLNVNKGWENGGKRQGPPGTVAAPNPLSSNKAPPLHQCRAGERLRNAIAAWLRGWWRTPFRQQSTPLALKALGIKKLHEREMKYREKTLHFRPLPRYSSGSK